MNYQIEFTLVEHRNRYHRCLEQSHIEFITMANDTIEFQHSWADIHDGNFSTGCRVESTVSSTAGR